MKITSRDEMLKRAMDILLSMLLLLLLSPLLLIIACIIKIDSPGKPFYRQKRLGRGGEVFHIIKFRTMVEKADRMEGGVFTHEKDPRITRVGRLLRKFSLDELPQLYNIIKGDMSFVGPRPPVPYHPYPYHAYRDEQKLRFTVRPGITGYAQVMGRNTLSWDERIVHDVRYVRDFNIFLDFRIMALTGRSIVKKENIYREG